jgi:hypothetical protein
MKNTIFIPSILMLLVACTTTYVVQKEPTREQTGAIAENKGEIKISEPTGEMQEVVADGVAAITSTADIARDHAISDVLRKAVEQAVGTFINSETAVKNFTLLKDEIYSHAQGYVSSYRIIDEQKDKDSYRVKVIAKVKLNNIENDLEAIGLLLREKGRPRIMFVIKEFKGETAKWEETSDIETMLTEKFTEKGFPVVDAAMVKRNLEVEQIRHIMEGDDKTAALLGLKLGAEIIITGKGVLSEAEKEIQYSQGTKKFYQTKINARAINTETAEVLAATTSTKDIPFSQETSKKDASDETADKMIKSILGKWQREKNVTQIYITGAEYSDIQKLKSGIQEKVRGVTKVIQRDFTGNSAILEVISSTSSQEVFDDLGTKDLGINFQVKGFSGTRIDIVIKKQ